MGELVLSFVARGFAWHHKIAQQSAISRFLLPFDIIRFNFLFSLMLYCLKNTEIACFVKSGVQNEVKGCWKISNTTAWSLGSFYLSNCSHLHYIQREHHSTKSQCFHTGCGCCIQHNLISCQCACFSYSTTWRDGSNVEYFKGKPIFMSNSHTKLLLSGSCSRFSV